MNNITQVEMLIFDTETKKQVCPVWLPQIPEINSMISLYSDNVTYIVRHIEYACDKPCEEKSEFVFDALIIWCEKEKSI